MAKASLSLDLYRNGKWEGTLRKFGGNKPDVKSVFARYRRLDKFQLMDSFPNFAFEFGDIISISCKWGDINRTI